VRTEISFEHRGPCRDPERHRHCPGLQLGEITLEYTEDGKRVRRKVSGKTRVAVVDKLRELHTDLCQGVVPKTGHANYTVRQAAKDWLANGLAGRSAKTIKVNQNMLEPILKVIGARKLRDLSAADVRQALSTMAAGYSSSAVTRGHLALKRAIRHAEANDLVSRNVATLVDTPRAQQGRPSRSLTLDQAVAVITAAKTLPAMELHPGLKDVRRPGHAHACLHRAEPAGRAAHRGSPGPVLAAREPGRRPASQSPVPPHVAVRRSVRVHGETKTERSRRTLALPRLAVDALCALRESQEEERLLAGERWLDTGLVFATQLGAALDAANVRKMFKRVCRLAEIGDSWTPRELRTSFVSLMSHHGVSIEEIARLVGHSSTRTTEVVYRRELRPVITTGAEIMDETFAEG
jgi:site-specific recombinase XerD